MLDFAPPEPTDFGEALSRLRQELKRKYRVQFRFFDLAYAEFWQRSHLQIPLRKENLPLLEEGEFMAEVIGFAEYIPGLGLVGKMPKLIEKAHGSIRDWWTKRGQQKLSKLQTMAPNEIMEDLPMFWAADLKDFMQCESRPVVLFIDTYEALWKGQRNEASFFTQDEWVRKLIKELLEVLWVIAGRDKLRWEELGSDWGNHRQHLIDELEKSYAREFLASCGITEEAVQRVIVEGSKGIPFYLDVSVDAYEEIKKQGKTPSPSDFGRTPKKVVNRFLSHLEESEEETLRVLSVARFWDRRLFKLLVKEFGTSYSATAMYKLCRFSFIQEERVPDTWTVHPLMREGLEEHQNDPELRGEVHQYLFDHYNHQLQGLESTAISDLHKTALTEAFHHGKHALATEELFEWFTTIEEIFRHAALWQFLTPSYEEFARLIEDRLGPEHTDTATSLNNLAELYRQQGFYEESEPLHERALGIREKVLGPEHPDTVGSLNNLALLYTGQGRYEEAESLHKRALEIREEVLGPEHPDTIFAMNNLAALYYYQGRYEEAEPLCERLLRINEKVLGPEHPDIAIILNNLAFLYAVQGRYEEAEPLHERALAIWEKVLGSEHPNTATGLDNLAGLCDEQERYEEAERLYQRALRIREKVLGHDHSDTTRTREESEDMQKKRRESSGESNS